MPADAIAEAKVVVLHVADKAFFGMYTVNGDLLARPMFVLNGGDGDGYFDELLLPDGQIGIETHNARLPWLDLHIASVDLLHDIVGNRSDVLYCHSSPQFKFVAEDLA